METYSEETTRVILTLVQETEDAIITNLLSVIERCEEMAQEMWQDASIRHQEKCAILELIERWACEISDFITFTMGVDLKTKNGEPLTQFVSEKFAELKQLKITTAKDEEKEEAK